MDLFVFDDDYVRRLQEGDRATEEHFVRYFTLFFTLKLRSRLRPNEIDDVIQEVFFRVLNGLRKGNTVRDAHKFGSYVNSIGNHVVQEGLNPRRRTEPLEMDIPSAEDVFANLVTAERRERVHAHLERLDEQDPRSAAILRDVYLNELDKDAICRMYEIDRDYLRVLVHRALKKIGDLMGDE